MKSQKIVANGVRCYLHFAILDAGPSYLRSDLVRDNNRKAVVLSVYDRSRESCMGFWANIHRGIAESTSFRTLCDVYNDVYSNEVIPISIGKESGYHMMAYTALIGKTTFICHKDHILDGVYSLCMNNTELPLLREWMEPLLQYAISQRMATVGHKIIGLTEDEREEDVIIDLKENGGRVPLSEIEVVTFNCADEQWIMSALQELHKRGQVNISDEKQENITVKSLDEYLAKYGSSIVDNLKKVVTPLTELSGNTENVALKKLRLFPQQLAQVNGGQALLDHENFLILNEGMGTGKTIQSISIVEGRENQKYMNSHPGTTLKDCLVKGRVKYRAIIMCPGHLPEKWAREVESNVPFAKATVLKNFSDIVALRDLPKEPQGKEWYVIGKDFCKLSYQSRPVPKIVKKKHVVKQVCAECGRVRTNSRGKEPCKCGCTEWIADTSDGRIDEGMICPSCGELLWPYVGNPRVLDEEEHPLMPEDFSEQKELNSFCYYCGESLWEPCVGNVDTDVLNVTGMHAPVSKWHKISHYTNARCNATKTVWVHEDYEYNYLAFIGKEKLADVMVTSARKYSPARYIKKYLKNFFDYGLFDEAHLYKGGATAQGNAFASIASVCKKQLLLTGTIANGYANALFYLLYRVAPAKMKALGFEWNSEMKFVKKYGTLETKYAADNSWGDGTYNKSSKGRQIAQPKVKPGISPLLMLDLLLPYQLTLDLSDMSKFLPPLKEFVVSVEPDSYMLSEYRHTVQNLKKLIRSKEGKTVMGTMLQFALSYPDKPYGRSPIVSAIDRAELAKPEDLSFLIKDGGLLEKEKKLVETVTSELSEGRNCVIYAEYTNSKETIVTQRLKYVLEENVPGIGKVEILESNSPKAIKREAWIHDKARKGTKVFITNPRCVETGLDFVWSEHTDDGEMFYNFPTLMFYQTGYNLYTVWQASRRHYRLSQTEECRTYYFAYQNTIQMDVLQILAEKQTATSAIQGKFSAEGLAKMAQQVDPRVKLAQSLCEADSVNVNELQEMFDVLNDVNNSENEVETEILDGYKPMLLFSEIITDGETGASVTLMTGSQENKESTFDKFLRISSDEGLIAWGAEFRQTTAENAIETLGTTEGKGKKKSIDGQMELFSMLF